MRIGNAFIRLAIAAMLAAATAACDSSDKDEASKAQYLACNNPQSGEKWNIKNADYATIVQDDPHGAAGPELHVFQAAINDTESKFEYRSLFNDETNLTDVHKLPDVGEYEIHISRTSGEMTIFTSPDVGGVALESKSTCSPSNAEAFNDAHSKAQGVIREATDQRRKAILAQQKF